MGRESLMSGAIRPAGEEVREYIFRNIRRPGLATKISEKFGITRQAANRHLRQLVAEGAVRASGKTQSREYRLARTKSQDFIYPIVSGLDEDLIWRNDIRPLLVNLPQNVLETWHWAFTEMFNNAIDHSEGRTISVGFRKTAIDAEIMIVDDGVGIFKKLKDRFNLDDERQALLELSKGKLTTDPKRHSGQGIFFTSRMVDRFAILSGETFFTHDNKSDDDWFLDASADHPKGTSVFLRVSNHTARTTKKILSQFSVQGSYGFNKTVVPVELARYGTDQLVSRSQAKRVLARVDQFSQVLLDFTGVDEIGQAFADEIFRVFANDHPDIEIFPMNANKDVMGIYQAALKSGRPGFKGKKTD
jgi:anti-sigma regulatory factor (Ser/Thr protein kinase)